MIRKMLSTSDANIGVALLILRVGVAILLSTHGYDKLQNLMAGNSADFPDPLHVSPTVSHGLSVFAEFFCSMLLILGLFTRFSLIVLIINMIVIITVIHAGEPLDQKEHALLFLIPFISLLLTGPGRYSLDNWLLKQ